jgi:hypothetical protein
MCLVACQQTGMDLQVRPNTVLGVIPSGAELQELLCDLGSLNLQLGCVGVLGGADLDQAVTHRRGARALLANIGRLIRGETALASCYRRMLADGGVVVAVRNVSRGQAGRVCDAITGRGGRSVQHYGTFTVALLAA